MMCRFLGQGSGNLLRHSTPGVHDIPMLFAQLSTSPAPKHRVKPRFTIAEEVFLMQFPCRPGDHSMPPETAHTISWHVKTLDRPFGIVGEQGNIMPPLQQGTD